LTADIFPIRQDCGPIGLRLSKFPPNWKVFELAVAQYKTEPGKIFNKPSKSMVENIVNLGPKRIQT